MKFYDRKTELDKLKKFETLANQSFFFIRVTGRRRIGKTILIGEYFKRSDCASLYFYVTKKKEKLLLDEYSSIIAETFDEYQGIGFKDFDDFFKFLFNLLNRKKTIAVFDEFQNFKYVDPAVFSILQKHIDANKNRSNGMLMVVGSINSMMRKIFEDHNQPLFGRLNGSFLLGHFSIETIDEILKDHGLTSNDDLLFFYSIFEGIPFYYNYIGERNGFSKSRVDFIKEDILDENSILLNEGKEILLEEFGKDYSTYFSILEAVASGATTVSRIADVSGITVNHLSRYITDLIGDFELLERRVPFDSKDNNKMGRYYIKDNFFDFWFRYIFKNKSRIEILSGDHVAADILNDLPVFLGKKFEKLTMSHLIEMNRKNEIRFDRIGQYWDRGETEIDIIFTDDKDKKIVFGECKLSPKRFNVDSMEGKIRNFLTANPKYVKWEKTLNLYTPGENNFLYKSIALL
jgi:uncharacterized protein